MHYDSDKTWVLIATDAIQRNDLKLLRTFDYRKETKDLNDVVKYAARHGSRDALERIWERFLSYNPEDHSIKDFGRATDEAIGGANIDTIRFFDAKKEYFGAIDMDSAIWESNAQTIEFILQKVIAGSELNYKTPSSYYSSRGYRLFKLRGTDLEEYMAVVQRQYMPKKVLQYMFACAVDMKALQLAGELLKCGARVNECCNPLLGRKRQMAYMKPLAIAVGRVLPEMVVFLLQNGAEMDEDNKGNKRGIEHIQKKMGMDWNEIVERYRGKADN
ncbi:hypothetical protein PG995_007789 [Apiospora arundinis]